MYRQQENRVITWANAKGILKNGTPLTQIQKTEEEVAELKEALFAQQNYLTNYINSKGKAVNSLDEIKDGLGDVLVTLIIQAKMNHVDLLECLELALNVIEKRTGRMINGTFVKDK